MALEDAVRVRREPWMFTDGDPVHPEWTVEIAVVNRFRLDTGEHVTFDPFA